MKEKMTALYKKYFAPYVSREVITYIIAGILTTAINYIIYIFFARVLSWNKHLSNVIAWVGAVSFAYVINDVWVFRQKKSGFYSQLPKMGKFFLARIFSFVVEVAGLYLLFQVLGMNDLIAKGILMVLVIILNYVLSKMFIFLSK